MKEILKLTNIIESIIFVSGNPIAISDIAEKLEIDEKTVLSTVKTLQEKYNGDSGIQLLIFNKKLQFSSNPNYAEDVSSVLNPIKERELSKSMLETAAIIAYKQPVTRMDLEEIRGNSEYAVQKLLELKVIEPVGRKDAVGKPVLFGTTDEFLKRFQISSLDELPDYDELLERIAVIHGNKQDDTDYLYQKATYNPDDEIASTSTELADSNVKKAKSKAIKDNKKAVSNNNDDFVLPDISEEEIPDFLIGENVEKL